MNRRFLKILLVCFCCVTAQTTMAQHFIGVFGGYAFNTMSSSMNEDLRNVNNGNNYGLIYRYYGGSCQYCHRMGIQTGINYTTRGYQKDSSYIRNYQSIEIPVLAQFHYDVWKIRAIIDGGMFASYLLGGTQTNLDATNDKGIVLNKESYIFKSTDNRFDYGLRFGGALALILHPLEIQFGVDYSMGFAYTHQPRILPVVPGQYTIYHNFRQMIFYIGALIAL